MNLQELETLLIDAQKCIDASESDVARQMIVAAKLMVQAEMARIGRIRAGAQLNGDERRAGE